MISQKNQYDVCVVGGGLTGLAAAVFLADAGLAVALIAPPRNGSDHRTTALLAHSVEALSKIGIWSHIEKDSFPLKSMRIVDATNRLLRSPQTDFHSTEIGLEAFGYNVRNVVLYKTFEQHILNDSNIDHFACPAKSVRLDDTGGIEVKLVAEGRKKSKTVHARFIVGADGRSSMVRDSWNIGERKWSYPQSAVVFNFEHEFSSNYTSTEFHTETGPFTIVPNTNHMAGLVWVETPERAQEIASLSKRDLALLAENKMQSFLGKLKIVSPVQCFPLSGMIAGRFGDKNCALVGEAAHVFPPIGAQGFNLGIRDIECVADILGCQKDFASAGEIYHRQRVSDVTARTTGVDLLNRTLLSNFLPMQLLRSSGLYALGHVPALRRYAMRVGISGVAVQ